jgi:hypothetical protein
VDNTCFFEKPALLTVMEASSTPALLERRKHKPFTCVSCDCQFMAHSGDSGPVTATPCGHTYCSNCITLVRDGDALQCTICSTAVTGEVKNIGLGLLADGIQAAAAAAAGGASPEGERHTSVVRYCIICALEDEETPATMSCTVCKDKWYCSAHAETHASLKRHDMKSAHGCGAKASAQRPLMCPDHPEYKCSRFCVTHNMLLCAECAVDHPKGEEHDLRKLEDLHGFLVEQVTAAVPELTYKQQEALAAVQRVVDATETMVADATALFEDIDSLRSRLHALIDEKCDEAKRRENDLLNDRTKLLQSKVSHCSLHLSIACVIGVPAAGS